MSTQTTWHCLSLAPNPNIRVHLQCCLVSCQISSCSKPYRRKQGHTSSTHTNSDSPRIGCLEESSGGTCSGCLADCDGRVRPWDSHAVVPCSGGCKVDSGVTQGNVARDVERCKHARQHHGLAGRYWQGVEVGRRQADILVIALWGGHDRRGWAGRSGWWG